MHQFGWLSKRRGNFLNLFQKEEGTQKGGVPSERRGGVPTLEETMIYVFMRPHVVVLLFIVIFYAKTSMQYVLIIWLFLEICSEFSLLVLSKAGFKRSLNRRKPLKNNIKWKKKAILKRKYMEITSLCSQYFSPGAGSNGHRT